MDSHSEDEKKEPLAEAAGLEFITFTDFNQTTHPETRKRVRSHVMHRVQQSLRSEKGKGKGREIALDLSLLSQDNTGPSRNIGNSALALTGMPRPHDLGAGRSDPFVKYPIYMDIRAHELFDHLHGDDCPMFKTMSRIGFFRTVADEAGFRQILCTSSSHMTKLTGGTETAEALALSTTAIRSINGSLTDPTLGTSDGTIVAILAFACHAVMFDDIHGLIIHFSGLEEIIRRRGGPQALRLNPAIRMVLFWVDVNTAFIHGRSPRFPSPDDILPRISVQPLQAYPISALQQACLTNEMAHTVNELLALNQLMVSELAARDLWDDGVFAGLNVVPILSKLLSLHYEAVTEGGRASARQEACRIGAILYLAGVRRRFGVSLATDVYIEKLKDSIIAQDGSNLEITDPILLWVLVIGGVQSLMHEEHNWFVSGTASVVIREQYSTWGQLMAVVCKVLWIEGILEDECIEFRGKVSVELWTSHGHNLW